MELDGHEDSELILSTLALSRKSATEKKVRLFRKARLYVVRTAFLILEIGNTGLAAAAKRTIFGDFCSGSKQCGAVTAADSRSIFTDCLTILVNDRCPWV